MSEQARHHCRNPRCRVKLRETVENLHKAFCTRGCHESFYLSRCLVCEDQMIRKRSNQRIKSGHKKCSTEYQRFPHVYAFRGPTPTISNESLANADSTGLQTRHRALRHWLWTDEIDLELELQDQAGHLLARLEHNRGRYRLTHPRTIPIQSWSTLEEAKHRAESMALMAIPLSAVDPKLAARIKQDNETPHPMGPPLNRQISRETAILSDWKPHASLKADIPDIPDFLRLGDRR